MTNVMPITAIVPVYNCADRLVPHLASINEWVSSVEEVIVIDSGSIDGTAEIARREIIHPRIRHEVVPPGLYGAWNHGVKISNCEFCYFATVGDTIKSEGLNHLFTVAKEYTADVVISPPRCITEEGLNADFRVFPVHRILEGSDLSEPIALEKWLVYLLATGFSIESFLGSSASNLYRTECLQRDPFPPDFGKAGDSAWMRKNALRYNFALTPKVCADFLIHQDHGIREHGEITDLLDRLSVISDGALKEWLDFTNLRGSASLRILNCWRDMSGISPEKTLDAIRHLEGVAKTAELQREYIKELEQHLDKRAQIINHLNSECERLQILPKESFSIGGMLRKILFRLKGC